jgi:hemoglobin-like flavoprotein
MTNAQIQLVQRTWRLLRSVDPDLLMAVFMARLQMEGLARKTAVSTRLKNDAPLLISQLSRIVTRLDQPEVIETGIDELIRPFLPDVIKPQQILFTGRALLWTLEQGLGKDWTTDVELAWRECYQYLGEQAAFSKSGR